MDETIARLNIEHFRKRLSEETSEEKRARIRELLALEEEKLREILCGSAEDRKQG